MLGLRLVLLCWWIPVADSFLVTKIAATKNRKSYHAPISSDIRQPASATNYLARTSLKESKKDIGDPIRAKTGIRPSLHPTTINALAQALKLRSSSKDGGGLRVTDDVQPLDVALKAGKIAADAISQRQSKSEQDGMTLTAEEEQTIAGRIVGVITRLEELETVLLEKVKTVKWIAKYGEWSSFGVLANESDAKEVDLRLKDDPLLCMTRAECLLALFLKTVEMPQLEQVRQAVPDKSQIDFLDSDRQEVLLS